MRGTFEVSFENIKQIYFHNKDDNKSVGIQSERISLQNSLGKLSFKLDSISEGFLTGQHPILGSFKIPIHEIKNLQCNLLLKSYREYITQLKLAEEELKVSKP